MPTRCYFTSLHCTFKYVLNVSSPYKAVASHITIFTHISTTTTTPCKDTRAKIKFCSSSTDARFMMCQFDCMTFLKLFLVSNALWQIKSDKSTTFNIPYLCIHSSGNSKIIREENPSLLTLYCVKMAFSELLKSSERLEVKVSSLQYHRINGALNLN